MQIVLKIKSKLRDGSAKEMWTEWKWIYKYTRAYRLKITGYMLLSMLGIVMGLVSSIASKNLIDLVTGTRANGILPMVFLMVGSTFFSMFLNSMCARISLKINLKIQNDIQANVFEQVMNVNWMELSKFHSGDILNRFGNDIKTVSSSAVGWLPQLVTGGFSFLASLAVILYYDKTMALIALINAPIMLLSSRVLMGKLRGHTKNMKAADSRMLEFQEETFRNIDSIKSFHICAVFEKKLKQVQKHYFQVNLEYNKFSILTNVALSVIGMLIEYSCFGWGIYRLWTGKITFGEMTLFLGQANKLSTTFSSLVSIVPSTIGATVSAGRIMELIGLPKEKRSGQKAGTLEKEREHGFGIHLESVSFGYHSDKLVLSHSSMRALPGEIVALVGPSGEGKTTLVRMLLGLIQPQEGTAMIQAKSGQRMELGVDTREYFSYVPQGNTLFSGSVADNLRMVKEDATEDEIKAALKTACAYEFVEQFPGGIYEILGENGHRVSEGQAQRISIARAVLRDAPILLLDEATSALDVATERKVLKNLIQKNPHKTCIVTTHRPSVLNMCSRVYRVVDARVTELEKDDAERMAMDF